MLPIYNPFIPYIPIWLGNKYFNYIARNYWPWELRSKISEHDFVWQAFENISGAQPKLLINLKSLFRKVANVLEKTFFLRSFSLSQFVVAKKAINQMDSNQSSNKDVSP